MICNIIDGPIRVVIRNFCGKPFTSCTVHISPIVLIILWYTVVRKIISVVGGCKYTELELWYLCVGKEVSFEF